MLPKIENYGQYSNSNYGAHTLLVRTQALDLYYSYETIVAYSDTQDGLVCSVNYWGVTTGKHLNWIQSDKSKRIDSETFKAMLENAIKRHIV